MMHNDDIRNFLRKLRRLKEGYEDNPGSFEIIDKGPTFFPDGSIAYEEDRTYKKRSEGDSLLLYQAIVSKIKDLEQELQRRSLRELDADAKAILKIIGK